MKAFENIIDWKQQFANFDSVGIRKGFLQTLLDGEDFEVSLDWQDDIPRRAEGLLWAITTAMHQRDVALSAIQILINSVYSDEFRIRRWDPELGQLLAGLRLVLRNYPSIRTDQPYARQIRDFLNGMISEIDRATGTIQREAIRTICEFGHYELLQHRDWLGSRLVLNELQARIGAGTLSGLVRDSGNRGQVARQLVIHLAADGKFDNVVDLAHAS